MAWQRPPESRASDVTCNRNPLCCDSVHSQGLRTQIASAKSCHQPGPKPGGTTSSGLRGCWSAVTETTSPSCCMHLSLGAFLLGGTHWVASSSLSTGPLPISPASTLTWSRLCDTCGFPLQGEIFHPLAAWSVHEGPQKPRDADSNKVTVPST